MARQSARVRPGADDPIKSEILDRTIADLSVSGDNALIKAANDGLPDRAAVAEWIERTKLLVLAQRDRSALRAEVPHLATRLLDLLGQVSLPEDFDVTGAVEAFLPRLAGVRSQLAEDVEAALEGDPAARSFAEIVVAYPSIRAVATHRLAHELHVLGVPILPRMMSEHAHAETGIDIHPGARIGRRFFIDHGTGVVIGETTIIGDNVRIYQGVTLGARSPRQGESLRGVKRHPTIEDDVTIYAGATVLGGDVVIGRDSVIGGNVWLTESVPPESKVIAESPRTLVRQRSGERESSTHLHWDI